MTLNRVKLGLAVTFIKYFTDAVSLILLTKTSNWNEVKFMASNSLNLAELVVNELMKSISKRKLPTFLFLSNLSLLNVKTSRTYV